ncbi:aldehyde dehydrogenase [Streptomyces humidus]|uniref:Aldehyde dehydrogenase n=1 Tax=Streptomyces humidus TaxID=52259 RepID=A0A918LBH7_9ACTN|nr:aldehyde dehydrogenase family protein [Streptomyces humidus]GGS26366.1 aldehyde dehydrogenase [Streptomyces humidus]
MTTQLSTPAAPDAPTFEDMLAALRSVHSTGRTRSLEWRLEQLDGITRLMDEREADIAEALAQDLGRNAAEAWLGDIASTRGEAVYARKRLRSWMKRRRQRLTLNQRPGSGWVQYEPLGVVLIIGPWNYPVYLSLGPLVAAVAAGNCAVVKPSELAPATSALLARLIPQYLDPEAVKVAEGDAVVTQGLLALGFDHVLFTGGTEVGKKIMAGAAPTLTPVTLELGGKSPVVVMADADLDVAARRIAWVKLMNSGQTCIAPDYVLAERSIRDALVDRIVSTMRAFRADQDGGLRIVNERQFDRLAGYLAATQGSIVTGGGTDRAGLTIEPTVIVDPGPEEPSMAEEIFGPILPVLAVDSLDAAVRFVNSRPKPLALYIFARSKATRRRLVDEIPAGGAVINHVAMHCLAPALPFGGVGESGIGSYHGEWGFQALSHRKAVLAKGFRPDLRLVYPPYTDRALKMMRRIL